MVNVIKMLKMFDGLHCTFGMSPAVLTFKVLVLIVTTKFELE